MPAPNLIRPLTVTIERGVKADTAYDRDAREPMRSLVRATVALPAQVVFDDRASPDIGGQGASEQFDGHLTFRLRDLAAKGYTPARGDHVVQLGNRATSLYVQATQDAGHWGDQSGHTLVKAWFSDRRPSASAPLA